MEEKTIKKVILARAEDFPVNQQVELGMTGRVVIEISKNSPLTKTSIKIDGTYCDYFEEKFKQGKMSAEQIRELGQKF